MKQFPSMKVFAVLAVLLTSLAVASCDNSFGVFSSIQTEKAQIGTTLYKNATVKALGEDLQNYYAVMSKVYWRSFAGASWTLLSVNGTSDYYAAGFASNAASGKIWVASANAAGTTYNGTFASTDGGGTWTELPSTAIGAGATVSVDGLFWVGDTLFALAHDHSAATYSLFYSDGSSAFAAVSGMAGMSFPVIGMAKTSSKYWALTQARAYSGTVNSTLTADATANTPTGTILTSSTGSVLGGIAVDAADSVLVTRSDGLLYTLASGAWTSATVLDSVKLGILAEVPTVKGGSDHRLLVAKHNSTYGYCEWNAATSTKTDGNGTSAVFSPTASGYTTTVYDKPVTAFHYSPTNGTILIGLAAQGSDTYALYSNSYSGSAWSGWTAE
jgi:hypothetical protein